MRIVVAVVLLVLTGCSGLGAAEKEEAGAAAVSFYRLLGQDPASACGVLAPGTLHEVEASGPCEEAMSDLPQASRVSHVDVYGKQAMVTLDGDVAFLALFPGGWRVTAAGCVPVAERPYECSVKGP